MKHVTEAMLDMIPSWFTTNPYATNLDEGIEPWRTRTVTRWVPYLSLDARYGQCQQNGQIVDLAVLVAIGADEEGH